METAPVEEKEPRSVRARMHSEPQILLLLVETSCGETIMEIILVAYKGPGAPRDSITSS